MIKTLTKNETKIVTGGIGGLVGKGLKLAQKGVKKGAQIAKKGGEVISQELENLAGGIDDLINPAPTVTIVETSEIITELRKYDWVHCTNQMTHCTGGFNHNATTFNYNFPSP